MKRAVNVGLIGDYDDTITAHQCIPAALKVSADLLGLSVKSEWLPTNRLHELAVSQRDSFNAFWCVPGSPYRDRKAVLDLIRHARTSNIPYLGTCGGYQHAVLEFAIHHLGLKAATLEEEDPKGEMLLISALPCRLVDEQRKISILKNSKLGEILGATEISEEYRCGFGMNPRYSHHFDKGPLSFVAFNEENIPQAFELSGHRFFMGTAFQPERSSRAGKSHPLVEAFLRAAL